MEIAGVDRYGRPTTKRGDFLRDNGFRVCIRHNVTQRLDADPNDRGAGVGLVARAVRQLPLLRDLSDRESVLTLTTEPDPLERHIGLG